MLKVIDIHPHVISPDTDTYPLTPLGGTQSSWSQNHKISYEELIAQMDSAGIAKAVVVQASTAYGHNNSYLADAVAAHPERFTGVFSVDVLAEDAVEKIKFWQGRNLTGMRLFTTGSTMPTQQPWLADERSHKAWEYASDVGLPIAVQMRPEGIPLLTKLIDRFPDVRVVLDHLARPVLSDGPPYTQAAGLFDLGARPNVFLKLTLRNILAAGEGQSTVEAFLAQLLERFGSARIAWGSNFPAADLPLSELLAAARSALAGLSQHDQEMIFAGTAETLYPALKTV
ncbi:amidohydrolase family protein [Rhizobium halophytocola]|uniref:TIM-barrel fold metal-dependent hydrolase n=1 Tax=Rhizobium halophytocola TaxID=735519 RepID=A0ABS4DUP3_9HYPH|nr:amidohydrolase family protein [Rhizobium halophytocola]MBP1849413.1 putative TIM-barrel fold metal-dependent hydrolase [Rhizobium halophytocola]